MDAHIISVIGGITLWTVVVPFVWDKIRSRRDRKAPAPEPKVMDVGQESVNYTPLTPELVKEAVRVNGYVPVTDKDGDIVFKVNGQEYWILMDSMPRLSVYRTFNFNPEKIDTGKFYDAALKVNRDYAIGKVYISDDFTKISFVSSFLEFTFANLCVSLCHYVGIVNDISQRHAELYTEMVNTPEETREEPKMLS